jgi:hypothetical protein
MPAQQWCKGNSRNTSKQDFTYVTLKITILNRECSTSKTEEYAG